MALDFGGMDSDRVNHGSASTLDNLGRSSGGITWLLWMYNDALGSSSEHRFLGKGNDEFRAFHPYWAGIGSINFGVGNATHFAEVEVHGLLTTGTWQCVAVWVDPSLSSNFGAIYYGTLTSPLASQSLDFTFREARATNDAANDLAIGNSASTSNSIDGRIAMVAFWAGKVPLANLIAQQYSPGRPVYTTGLRLFANYGLAGTGNQPDWSGNGNHGTVTGATQAAHVPLDLRLTRRVWPVPTTGTGAIEGTLTATLGDATLSATGEVDVDATLSATLADATLSAAGNVDIDGSATPILDNATLSSAGAVDVNATLTATLDNATLSATGGAVTEGTLDATLADATLSAAGTVAVAGTVAETLDDAALSGAGTVAVAGTATPTLDDATSSAIGEAGIDGALTATLADATLSAAGSIGDDIDGTLTVTLGDATLSAAGTVGVGGAVTATLGDVTLFATGTVEVDATLSAALQTATITAVGAVLVDGTLDATLGSATLSAGDASPPAALVVSENMVYSLVLAESTDYTLSLAESMAYTLTLAESGGENE